jgi:hypothetical protein
MAWILGLMNETTSGKNGDRSSLLGGNGKSFWNPSGRILVPLKVGFSIREWLSMIFCDYSNVTLLLGDPKQASDGKLALPSFQEACLPAV